MWCILAYPVRHYNTASLKHSENTVLGHLNYFVVICVYNYHIFGSCVLHEQQFNMYRKSHMWRGSESQQTAVVSCVLPGQS